MDLRVHFFCLADLALKDFVSSYSENPGESFCLPPKRRLVAKVIGQAHNSRVIQSFNKGNAEE